MNDYLDEHKKKRSTILSSLSPLGGTNSPCVLSQASFAVKAHWLVGPWEKFPGRTYLLTSVRNFSGEADCLAGQCGEGLDFCGITDWVGLEAVFVQSLGPDCSCGPKSCYVGCHVRGAAISLLGVGNLKIMKRNTRSY